MIKNDELPEVYSGTDIACWPIEPTASMIEASSCGLPIIGNINLSERYKNNNGIGVKENDISELAEALLLLINDKEKRVEMGKNGRKLIENELSWRIIGQRFLDIKPKLLFISPLPPPITGQSFAGKVLAENLLGSYDLIKLNYSRQNAISRSSIDISFIKHIFELGKIIKQNKNKVESVYFTITQSLLGNLKDLYFLFKLGKKLRAKTVIHLHGGYFDEYFRKAPFVVKLLNKALFKDIKYGIVLSESLVKCLEPIINKDKIKIVPNFFEDDIKISGTDFNGKWNNPEKYKIVFLSNLMADKGYLFLLEGFMELSDEVKSKFELCFAGDFEDDESKKYFLDKIKWLDNIKYSGVVKGEEKKKLLHGSHIFILPTFYKIEGQPITILESYASGLTVFTTDQGGIKDIFSDGVNGKLLEKRSKESIRDAVAVFLKDPLFFKETALNNLEYSQDFTKDKFVERINDLVK